MAKDKLLKKFLFILHTSKLLKPVLIGVGITFFSGLVVFIIEFQSNEGFQNLFDGIWWAMATVSSTGYGDIYPTSVSGRVFGILTIFIGIGMVSYLSGVFASLFVDSNSRARRGLVHFNKIKNHLVICGWSKRMKDILINILDNDPTIDISQIILLSNVDPEALEDIKENSELSAVKFVRGEYFSLTHLKRTNIEFARKVIVLADSLNRSTFAEIDSKTIMTVMTIKSISKDLYVCAELLDKKYESNLKQALCDEIIYSREMSKSLIAGAAVSQGMAHIVYNLLSGMDADSTLQTLDIPDEFVGMSFKEYRKGIDTNGMVILGFLENAVTVNLMKMDALREAQKTTDISKLVNNMQAVKTMNVNRPVFAPESDYLIKRHSMAIILKRAQNVTE